MSQRISVGKLKKKFCIFWFTFESKFRPEPKPPILPEPKPEFSVRVGISDGTGTEPNFGQSQLNTNNEA